MKHVKKNFNIGRIRMLRAWIIHEWVYRYATFLDRFIILDL